MACSFHADFELWKFSADGTEFFQKQIETVNGIRKLEGFSNKFAVIRSDGSLMSLFSDIDTNKKHKILLPKVKRFCEIWIILTLQTHNLVRDSASQYHPAYWWTVIQSKTSSLNYVVKATRKEMEYLS